MLPVGLFDEKTNPLYDAYILAGLFLRFASILLWHKCSKCQDFADNKPLRSTSLG
jgi:hypothetical protein